MAEDESTGGVLEQIPVAVFIEDIDKFMVSAPPHSHRRCTTETQLAFSWGCIVGHLDYEPALA